VLTQAGPLAAVGEPAYAAEVFDALAPTFEATLTEQLGYRVPWLAADALEAHAGALNNLVGDVRVADLGCGSGLVGKALRREAAELVGIDVSQNMVDLARATGRYTEAVRADVHEYLEGRPDGSLEVIVSADTFIYVGALERFFAAAARTLVPAGLVVFSVEKAASDGAGLELGPKGRYRHGLGYIRGACAAAGFAVVEEQAIVVRTESAVPVHGWLVTCRRGPPGTQ
jgi:predicted TPR repeat methyltransferase